jgi:gas vesicle protein
MGKISKGLTIGAIIGFFAGLLLAPEKGEETRKKVQDAIEKGKDKLNEIKSSLNKDNNG